MRVDGNEIIRLTRDYETVTAEPEKGDFVVITYDRMHWGVGDMYWLRDFHHAYYLVSLNDGSRKRLNISENSQFWFSPGGRYLLYFDSKKTQYYSYDLQTGRVAELSGAIPNGWLAHTSKYYKSQPANSAKSPASGGLTHCWVQNDLAVWVYDNYDIWQLDLAGKQAARNMTQGYGRANKIQLKLIRSPNDHYIICSPSDPLLLVAYNTENK